ncbi:hypothetical protein [Faucicola boevrei]|uniref:hypothetical protein n=1 Tax=Faucicola boevrei TaxID=346665 RepID=UPI000378E17E|nr:hypothetical protein [Moraxella boevrei]
MKNSKISQLSYLVGVFLAFWLWAMNARADTAVINQFPSITPSMFVATLVGAIGSYLAFGEDKKFPPSATAVGHVLLGFGAGLFFTKGSLELMGRINASHDIVLFVSFLWAVGGYFILRLAVSVANSDKIKDFLPNWLVKILGKE